MKNLKFHSIFILLFAMILSTSCVNNDSKGTDKPDKPGTGGEEIPLTPENLEKGDWEIAYLTQRIRATNDGNSTDVTFRMYGMDGFTKEFYKDSLYMERNTDGEKTINEGKFYLFPKNDSIILKYNFDDPDTGVVKDSTSRIQVYKLSEEILVYHISYKGKSNTEPALSQLVFYLRNKKKAPDAFLESNDILKTNEKKGRIDLKSLNGSWKVVSVSVSSKSATSTGFTPTDADKEEQKKQEANIGLVYTYNTLQEPYRFTEAQLDGTQKTGVFTITDDVMHYYHENEIEGKTKKVMESMAVDFVNSNRFRYTYNIYNLKTTSFTIQRVIVTFDRVQK